MDAAHGPTPCSRAVRRSLGDAGEMLDAKAKVAYRRRLEEFRDAVEDAEAVGNVDAAFRHQGEIDALVAELARAVGLGGRDRRVASGVERG